MICSKSVFCFHLHGVGCECLQGLSDTEEFVIHKTLGALKTMVELGLMQKQVILEFVSDVVPLLAHPVSKAESV